MQQPYSYPDMSAFQPSMLPGQFPAFPQASIQGTPSPQFPVQGSAMPSFVQGAPLASYSQALPISYGAPLDATSQFPIMSTPFVQPLPPTNMLPFVQSATGQPEYYVDPHHVSNGYVPEANGIIMPKGFMTKAEYVKRRAQQEVAAAAKRA
eukprot:747367-Hanusia_phi.AAC.1